VKKKSLLLTCSALVFLFSSVSCVFAGSASTKELFFGPVVTGLGGTSLVASKTQGETATLNKASLAAGKQETLHFSLDLSKTSLETMKSKDYVSIDGLKPHGIPGEPQVPFQSFVLTLPADSEVLGVNVSGVAYRPIFNKLDIALAPMPVSKTAVGNGERTGKPNAMQVIGQTATGEKTVNKNARVSKCNTCDSDSFFPGNLVSYMTSGGSENLLVFIKFFPMQYVPGSKHAILITNADITVNYQITGNE